MNKSNQGSGSGGRRDILGDILSDPQTGRIRGIDALNELIHACAVGTDQEDGGEARPGKSGGRTVRKREARRRSRRPKKKTTHYLTEEVFDNLGDAKKMIKDFLPKGAKAKATKSSIVESAVRVILDDFERKGEDSYLVQELIKKK